MFLLIMGEDSMSGRPFWSWFEHNMYKLHRIKIFIAARNSTSASTSQPDVYIESSLDPIVMHHPMVGAPIIYKFGHPRQFPNFSIEGIHNVTTDTYTDSYEVSGILYFKSFQNRSPAGII